MNLRVFYKIFTEIIYSVTIYNTIIFYFNYLHLKNIFFILVDFRKLSSFTIHNINICNISALI